MGYEGQRVEEWEVVEKRTIPGLTGVMSDEG